MTSTTHYVLYDRLYRADQKTMFTWMLSLRITDFAWAVEFGEASQDPGRSVLLLPSGFCNQRQSVPLFWSFRLSQPNSVQDHMQGLGRFRHRRSHVGPDRGFLCFAELEHVVPADVCRPEDEHRHLPVRC
jgi:hypothetical protein